MIIVSLMECGWHGLRALLAVVNHRTREDIWRNYMASVAYSIGAIASGFGGGEYPLPSYYELLHKDDPKDDEMSGKEIIANLIERLGKENDNATV